MSTYQKHATIYPQNLIFLAAMLVLSAMALFFFTESPAAKAFFNTGGTEPFTTPPDALAKFQEAETQEWGKVIKAAGIETE